MWEGWERITMDGGWEVFLPLKMGSNRVWGRIGIEELLSLPRCAGCMQGTLDLVL